MPSTPPIDVNDGKWPAWHYAQYMTLWDFPTWQYIYVLVIAITMVELLGNVLVIVLSHHFGKELI